MSTVASQLKVGSVVSITSSRLGLTSVQATVTRVNVMSIPESFFCETSAGEHYAFFGDEVNECTTIIS